MQLKIFKGRNGFRHFVIALLSVVFGWVGMPARGVLPESAACLSHVLKGSFQNSVYVPGSNTSACAPSEAKAESDNFDDLRIDIEYMDPTKCRITEAKGADKENTEKFVAAFEQKDGLGNVAFVKVDGNDTRQVILTNLHVFIDKNGHLPRINKDGSVDKDLFKIYSAACGRYYSIESIHPCRGIKMYGEGNANDCTTATLSEPACSKVESITIKEVSKTDLDRLQKTDSITLVAAYLPGLVCHKPRGSTRYLDLTSGVAGTAGDANLYVSKGKIVGGNANDSLFSYDADMVHMSSGAPILSHFGTIDQTLIGINVGGAGGDVVGNNGIHIDADVVKNVREQTSKLSATGSN